MIECKYGCGRPGIFEGKGFYSKGQFRCEKSANSCPALKQKNKNAQPYNDPLKKEEIVKKIQETIRENLGEDWKIEIGRMSKEARIENNPNTYFDAAQKLAETNMKIYGVRAVTELEFFREKVKMTNLERYGVPSQFHRKDLYEIRRRRELGNQKMLIKNLHEQLKFDNSDSDKTLYYRLVRKLSAITRRSLNLVVPNGYHVDHKFSRAAGYFCHVPPEIISHPFNLEILSASQNCSKHDNCSISIDELMEQWYQNRPNWLII